MNNIQQRLLTEDLEYILEHTHDIWSEFKDQVEIFNFFLPDLSSIDQCVYRRSPTTHFSLMSSVDVDFYQITIQPRLLQQLIYNDKMSLEKPITLQALDTLPSSSAKFSNPTLFLMILSLQCNIRLPL